MAAFAESFFPLFKMPAGVFIRGCHPVTFPRSADKKAAGREIESDAIAHDQRLLKLKADRQDMSVAHYNKSVNIVLYSGYILAISWLYPGYILIIS